MASETTLTNFTINYLTQAQFDALTTKEANEFYLTPDSSITDISAGTGLSGGGSSGAITINHSNSVSAKTTQAFYPIAFDSQGHITSSGTAITPLTEHYTTHLYVGTSNGSANAATSNGSTYLMVLDNSTVRDRRKISGTQNVSVSSDSSGNITITGPDLSPYLTVHNSYNVSTTGNGNAVTAVSLSGTTFTVTKGSTFLTSHQDISGKADKSATVSTVEYDSTNAKITKTINGTKSDVVTIATLKSALGSMPASDVYSWAKASSKPTYTASEVGAATSGHTHTTSIATSSDTNQITLAHGTKYAITAGGTSYVFTMPADNNTTYSAGTGLSLSGTTFNVKLGYTTSGNNRAVKADSNGNLYVEQKDDNTTYTLSGLGGVGSVSASGTAPLTLSASKSGTTVTITGSISVGTGTNQVAAGNHTHSYAGSDSAGGPANTVKGAYTANGGQQNPNYFGTNKVGFLMMNTTVNGNSQYKDWIIMDCYSGNDVGGGVALGVNRQSLGAYIMRSAATRTSWAESAELLGTHHLGYTASGKNYPVVLDSSSKKMYVNVPWTDTDTNTTYSAGTGLSLSGTTFSVKLGYTTSGNKRAVQADSSGNLYVEQKDDNTTYTLSGLGGVGTVNASGTAPLTLSASKSGTTVSISGSVAEASTSAKGVVTTGTQSFKGDKTFQSNTFRIRNENNDNNQAGSNPWITQLNLGDGNYVTMTEYKDDHMAIRGSSIVLNTDSAYSVYDATKTYSVGNIVWYNRAYYRCTTAITTAEAWTSGHWTEMPTSGIMANANLNPWKDDTYDLGSSSYRWKKLYAVTFDGNATSATSATTASKLGTSTVGGSTVPIYLSNGWPNTCSTYAGGTAVTLNGSDKGASTASFYAPTSAGTSGYYLKSNGSGAPTWAAFPTDNDTKDTAGSSNKTGTKMYLVAATSQSSNITTYSNSNCYIGTDNCLYSGGSKVLTAHQTITSSMVTTALGYTPYNSTNPSSFTTLQAVYPVGAIYISTVNTNPKTLFGFGTWDPIEGQFLLGANSTYTAGSSGGSPYLQEHTHTLSHTHTMSHTHGTGISTAKYFLVTSTTGSPGDMGKMTGTGRHYFWQSDTSNDTYWGHPQNTGDSSATNTGAASNTTTSNHNQTSGQAGNMPPYLAVYMWKRTA